MALRNDRTGLFVAQTLEPAFDSASRNRGLLGRDGMTDGHAIVLGPTNLIHTFFMRFPIDILFVSRAGVVLKAVSDVPARRLVGAWRGFAVIEMKAGSLAASGTRLGDTISLIQLGAGAELKVSP
jgi:uncharacterized membrane protein (UPF0127 family)